MTTPTATRTARRRSPRHALLATAAGAAVGVALAAAPARAAVEENYASGEPPVTSTWFAPVSDAAQRADREYVAGMRPHHAGALSMSREYLADPGRSSPLLQALARAIIANQTFEIGVLDEVGRNLDRPPVRLPFGVRLQPVATEGLTGAQRFFKEPIPSEATHGVGPVSERDVQFAKAMTTHHEAAVEMAREYQANAEARNGYLGLMNVDIVTDQTQEIALMRRAIAAYPGDASLVRVDPSMVHGMEGMKHGGGHGGHGAPPAGAARPAQEGAPEHRHHSDHGRHGQPPHGANHAQHGQARHGAHAGHGRQHGRAARHGEHAHHGARHGGHGEHAHHGARGGAHGGPADPAEARAAPARARPAARPPASPAGQGHHGHHHQH